MYRFVSVFFVGIHVQVCFCVLCRFMYRFVSVFFVGIHVQVCFCVLCRIHVQVCFCVLCRYPCTGLFLCSL